MNLVVGLLILFCAIVVVELGDFYLVPGILGLQGGLFAFQFFLDSAGIEVLPLTLFSTVIVPALLYLITVKTKRTEERPIFHGLPSTGLLVVLITISYVITAVVMGLSGVEWAIILTGGYGLLIKTDLRKIVASISILISTIHLFTPALSGVIEWGLLTLSTILILLLLYFAKQIFSIKGSLSTRDLKELRF